MPSQDDERLAGGLAAKLVRSESHGGDFSVEFSQEERDIPLGDVVENARDFLRAAGLLRQYGLGFPCIGGPETEPIPVSFGFEDGPFADFQMPGGLVRDAYAHRMTILSQTLARSNSRVYVKDYSVNDAESLFEHRLQTFLAIRFGARRSSISGTPGFLFTVATTTKGLTVVYGAASYLKPRPFQAPTTPVSQWIQPGGWIFGVATSGPTPRWDPAMLQYNVPPDTHAILAL